MRGCSASYWAGADAAALKPLAAAIAAAQQSDGGWRQIDGLASDAYATGQSRTRSQRLGWRPKIRFTTKAWRSCSALRPRTDHGGS